MPIFSKLFEMLPDAEQLLSLEPEELAGPLLVSLQNTKQILRDSVISHDDMKHAIDRNSRVNYPYECHEDVLFALMEAWQCLLSEGFVAPIPTNLPHSYPSYSVTTYFVTRRGQKIKTLEGYEDYRKADLLRKHQLHRIIADKVWRIFAHGDYDAAVSVAFKHVEIAVRKAGSYKRNDRGTDLMRRAFHVDKGHLTDIKQETAVKQAMSDLFAGAIGLYKNPSSHHEVEFAPEAAAEIIIIASHLLRIVDSCAERIANSSD